jgi:hypothetical protein
VLVIEVGEEVATLAVEGAAGLGQTLPQRVLGGPVQGRPLLLHRLPGRDEVPDLLPGRLPADLLALLADQFLDLLDQGGPLGGGLLAFGRTLRLEPTDQVLGLLPELAGALPQGGHVADHRGFLEVLAELLEQPVQFGLGVRGRLQALLGLIEEGHQIQVGVSEGLQGLRPGVVIGRGEGPVDRPHGALLGAVLEDDGAVLLDRAEGRCLGHGLGIVGHHGRCGRDQGGGRLATGQGCGRGHGRGCRTRGG